MYVIDSLQIINLLAPNLKYNLPYGCARGRWSEHVCDRVIPAVLAINEIFSIGETI